MKNELEKVFDCISATTTAKLQDYTDSETGLLHCGNCHTPKQCLDRIRRLIANGLQDRAFFAYTFDKADNDNTAMKYAHRYGYLSLMI